MTFNIKLTGVKAYVAVAVVVAVAVTGIAIAANKN